MAAGRRRVGLEVEVVLLVEVGVGVGVHVLMMASLIVSGRFFWRVRKARECVYQQSILRSFSRSN